MTATQTTGQGNCQYVAKHAKPVTPDARPIEGKLHPVTDEVAKAHVKVRVHITLIMVSGAVSTVLYIVHAANPALLGFAPIGPSIIQEIVDRIKYL